MFWRLLLNWPGSHPTNSNPFLGTSGRKKLWQKLRAYVKLGAQIVGGFSEESGIERTSRLAEAGFPLSLAGDLLEHCPGVSLALHGAGLLQMLRASAAEGQRLEFNWPTEQEGNPFSACQMVSPPPPPPKHTTSSGGFRVPCLAWRTACLCTFPTMSRHLMFFVCRRRGAGARSLSMPEYGQAFRPLDL